jgi:hypothetical protein
MEAYYQAIATEIVSHCPKDFREATLTARLEEGASEFSLRCVAGDGEVVKPRVGGLSAANVDDALADLRQHWPSGRFSTCAFTLKPDGKFKFDVGYDD